MSEMIAVIDLGEHNSGSISAGDVSPEQRQQMLEEAASPEYQRAFSGRIGCVDQRVPEEGLQYPEGVADGQIAGGPAVNETAVDMMETPNQTVPVSELIAKNTRESIDAGVQVIIHDACGASKNMRQALLELAQNADIVAPIVWSGAQFLKLDADGIGEDDITRRIVTGGENAKNDALWDTTAEQNVEIAVANGAIRHTFAGAHHEKNATLKIGLGTIDREAYMKAHPRDDGDYDSAFFATLGEYKKFVYDKTLKAGGTRLEAAGRMVSTLLFNVGALKTLLAHEPNPDEAFPIALIP